MFAYYALWRVDMDSEERKLTRKYVVGSLIACIITLLILIVWWIIVGVLGEKMQVIAHGGLLNQLGAWIF
jgi:hypothetical protein